MSAKLDLMLIVFLMLMLTWLSTILCGCGRIDNQSPNLCPEIRNAAGISYATVECLKGKP